MSRVRANNFTNKAGTGSPTFPYGAVVTGVITATSFSGDGSGLAGVGVVGVNTTGTSTFNHINVTGVATAATLSVSGNATVTGNLTVSGTQTIINTTTLEVEDKNIGISSVHPKLSDANLDGAGLTIHGLNGDKTLTWDNSNSRMAFSTDLYAPRFYGDGSSLTGISVGLTTEATSPSANTVVALNLDSAQHHELTLTAGITTLTCSGGSMGDSHSVILIQPSSGIATVGFSTFFLFPSGATPAMSEGSGKFDLISFVVKRVGAGGTQLLASAGLNYQ